MEECSVLIETTKSAEDKTSRWFDLPIDYELFRDLLGVEADSKDYQITDMKLPFAGDIVRTTSVRRLNKLYFAYTDLSPEVQQAFTLNVQISKEQQLITNGMYKFVRHPAYTGSILSLLGVSIALKNIPAIVIVAICSFVCYQIRINVEEAVLQKYFKEYKLYKEKTYKLFPYIY